MSTYSSWAGLLALILLTLIFRSAEIAKYWLGYSIIIGAGVIIVGGNMIRIHRGHV